MDLDARIDRLADLVGIEPSYRNVWGERTEVSRETKRALVAAMGLPTATDEEIESSLREAEARPWRRMLAPVRVFGPGEPFAVSFTLPEALDDGRVAWTVTKEDGGEQGGEVEIAALPGRGEGEVDGTRFRRRELTLPIQLPLGYHRLRLEARAGSAEGRSGETRLIVAPDRCLTPEDLAPGARTWGFAVQLYGVRTEDDWGIGDFGALAPLARVAAGLGADTVGLNPLHALFPADPTNYYPYSPSTRSLLNALYIDVEEVSEWAESDEARARVAAPEFQDRIRAARTAELVDYPAVAALKLPVLETLYETFRRNHLDAAEPTPRARRFHDFRREMGDDLRRLAVFDALHERFFGRDPGLWSWRDWPDPFRRHDSPEVAAFSAENARRVEFFEYLQWIADEQLAAAQSSARDAGMAVGFYRDLAVGNHPGGAASWAAPDVFLTGASVGAPPDVFAPHGQNWGLAPISPVGMREAAYQPFVEVVRANMRHAGALRIDHVMGLQRLYWIPEGRGAEDGAYVAYPLQDLIRIIALESHRNRALVIGEDLGTVPEGFRPTMEAAGILSYRVLYFEQNEQGFLRPDEYPENALVSVTTHDLATLRGFWAASDHDWRRRAGIFREEEDYRRALDDRGRERVRLLRALRDAGVLPEGIDPEGELPPMTPELVQAVYRYLAQTPGRILMVAIEDALGETEQPNLPGTTTQHPNWRRRLPLTVGEIGEDPDVRRLAAAIRSHRPGRAAGG